MEGCQLGVALGDDAVLPQRRQVCWVVGDAAEVARITSIVTDGAELGSLFVGCQALFGRSLPLM